MSTQMEMLMQLYMMNLLQQQQQQTQIQQQQQQHFSKDIISSTTTASTITATAPNKEEQPNTRTLKRNNSQNTNCSSSSSCSPNSNFSPTSSALLVPSIQQLLFNNLPPMATQMTQQQTPLPTSTPSTNLLLTPTITPNSMLLTTALSANQQQASQTLSLAANCLSSNSISNNFAQTNIPLNSSQILAKNFIQSSTVTSTPTEKSSYTQEISTVGESVKTAGDVVDDEVTQSGTDEQILAEQYACETKDRLTATKSDDDDDDGDGDGDDDEDDDEDEKPLSSLLSSSGNASTNASSENSAKLLLSSGVHPLESTSDSLDSTCLPDTPTKRFADSSNSLQKSFTIYRQTTVENEDSNVTPIGLANAILTPPSSEQLTANTFESSQSTFATSGIASLSAITTLDAFLQNEENLKNLKKVSSYLECGNIQCQQENLREHFHCHEEPCESKTLSKKDDIIRHLKWHKKRKESLLLGFARFSTSDNCSLAYGAGCVYNYKQTHYHCVFDDCTKVYVSTSDVQMHANFHRKNSEIVQEGFRRFRAHENCRIEDCPFFGKKISHYHCCREGCNHTFKNKADMEKHKTYHLKDSQLIQDGFKKILKTESCPFKGCKFSSVCNHIHCVRENCSYVLQNSNQIISHKRKHERLDGEQAYQNFKKNKDISEEEPAKPLLCTNVSTPLSSLSAEQFLARKRGRPPKKIQLPKTDTKDVKRVKTESDQQIPDQPFSSSTLTNPLSANLFAPFLPNFNPALAAAAAQSLQSQDLSAPNFQLTHLMALFQLQNPLFYQNLYPAGMAAANLANMASMLGANSGILPQSASIFGNVNAFNASGVNGIKTELNDKQQFKE
ncbi:transcription factor castor [Teleopsis dalmanni]|uniref:transcription factor castor n=1 Tax=Teleopsis dalmanni TaxID=139649 RepID=UPI0018CEBE97|nr:transcription factor castor [Teleopsis dalmanni]